MSNIERSLEDVCIASGSTYPSLATQIAEAAGVEEIPVDRTQFKSSEVYARYEQSIRGKDLFIVQSFGQKMAGDDCQSDWSVNDATMEAYFMIDAARRASARSITLVAPYFPYARQDRKAIGREPISAKQVAQMMTAPDKADRLMSIDLHSGQIQGFTDKPFDHLTAEPVLKQWIKGHIADADPSEYVMVAPDAGRAKVTETYAKDLDTDFALVIKKREKGGVKGLGLVGEIAAKHCVIIDDMIDTAGTLKLAATTLREQGAASIVAVATHGVLSGAAAENIRDSDLDKVVATDTLPLKRRKEELKGKLHIETIAPIVGSAIVEVATNGSVSGLFEGRNHS